MAEEVGSADSRGPNGIDGLHAPLDHLGKLFCVVAVRIDAGVSAEGHPGSRLECLSEILALQMTNQAFFIERFGKDAILLTARKDVVIIVDVEDEIRATLLGKANPFFVNEAGVLDGVDPSADGILDRFRTVGMCGGFAAEPMGFRGDGLHFLERILRDSRMTDPAHDTAGGADLDDIGAEFDHFADLLPRGPGAVCHTFSFNVEFAWKQVFVAMPSGYRERRTGNHHAWAGDIARIDAVTHRYVRIVGCADVADGGKPGEQQKTCVLYPCNRFARDRDAERLVAGVLRIEGDMGVDVDQTGQTSRVKEIDGHNARGCGACGSDRGDDPVLVPEDELIVEQASGANVEKLAAENRTGSSLGFWKHRNLQYS